MMVVLSASGAASTARNSFGIMYLRTSPGISLSGGRDAAEADFVGEGAAAAGLADAPGRAAGSAACATAPASDATAIAIRTCIAFSRAFQLRPRACAQGSARASASSARQPLHPDRGLAGALHGCGFEAL